MPKKSKDKWEKVWLVCEECGERNYMVTRKRGLKLRFRKYCPKMRKHAWHSEKRSK